MPEHALCLFFVRWHQQCRLRRQRKHARLVAIHDFEPEAFELVAVTTVGRHGAVRARVAASLLGLAGRSDVETCIGAEAPLLRQTGHFNWFDHEADCVAEAPLAPISDEPAAERIVRASHEHPGLELVAIGPMTNLARALALDPTLRDRVGGVTIMGGHVREARIGGFVAPRGLDYNLCSDPEASVADSPEDDADERERWSLLVEEAGRPVEETIRRCRSMLGRRE